jgi:Tol biopolymer transport system component
MDIFVVNVDDLLENGAQPRNITNNPNTIDDDPDWSPDGQHILFTSHDVNDNPTRLRPRFSGERTRMGPASRSA